MKKFILGFLLPLKIFASSIIVTGGGGSGSGTVGSYGPTTVNAIARWSTTAGNSLKNSGILIDDSANITGINTATFTPVGSPTSIISMTTAGVSGLSNGIYLTGTIPSGALQRDGFLIDVTGGTSGQWFGVRSLMSGGSYANGAHYGFFSQTASPNTGDTVGNIAFSGRGNAGGAFVGSSFNATGLGVGLYGSGFSSRRNLGGQFGAGSATAGTQPQAMGAKGWASQENSARSIGLYGAIGVAASDVEDHWPYISTAGLFNNSTAVNDPSLLVYHAGSSIFRIEGGDIVAGASVALTRAASRGFLNIHAMPGAPTGVPNNYQGNVPLTIDTTGNAIYFYNNGWQAVVSGSGITTLNTLTAASQSFVTGTSGADFNVSSSVSTHTFNLPDAGAGARGVVTTGTQSFAGAKTFSSDLAAGASLAVSGNVSSIKGVSYTFPESNGSGVLTNNGSGLLTWTAPSVASSGITSINGTTGSSIALVPGTTGSDFNFVTGPSTITANLPDAGSGSRGVVTTTAQTIAGVKTFSSNPILSGLAGSSLVLYADTSKQVQTTNTSFTEIDRLRGITSPVQAQLNTKLDTLNTLTGTSQSFATGTSGTDFAINSSGTTHTFNIPSSSGTSRGALTSTDWTTFNNKVGSIGGSTGSSITLSIGTAGTDFNRVVGPSEITLNLPDAGSASRGVVTTGTQTFSGVKTFSSNLVAGASVGISGNLSSIKGVSYVFPESNSSGVLTNNGSGLLTWVASSQSGITSINGSTGSSISLVSGTSGTDFNIITGPSTVTLNLPDAGSASRGVVTTGSQTLAGTKTLSSNPILSGLTGSSLVLYADTSKQVQTTNTSFTEIDRVRGVTSPIQNQLNTKLDTLNTLTGTSQTFATGTSGTDFAISSSGTTHTFNIPDAGASARGLITTGVQSFAGAKTFNSNLTAGSSLIVTGNISSIKGVSYTFPESQGAASTFLKNNGSGALTWATVSASGGFPATLSVSSNVTLTSNTVHLVSTSSARTLTLPSPASATNPIIIKDVSGLAGTNGITVLRSASEQIEGVGASILLQADWGAWTIITDGTNWYFL